MSNPNLEPKVKELMELRRMKEELDARSHRSKMKSSKPWVMKKC